MPSVLFVCLGNICRSPLAEGIMRAEARGAGLDLLIDSAGTGDWHIGHPPDPRAQAVAREHGLDISDLRARQVTTQDFDRFAHIVAMDRQNLADLEALRPAGSAALLSLLLGHAQTPFVDVPDPYQHDAAAFAETYALVAAGVRGLLASLSASA